MLDQRKYKLYKTELCRNWQEMGNCRYAKKCRFAHGHEELRCVKRHVKYKTDICRTFHETGTCSYGVRCNFIHDEPSTFSSSSALFTSTLSAFAQPFIFNKNSQSDSSAHSSFSSGYASSMTDVLSTCSVSSNSTPPTSPLFATKEEVKVEKRLNILDTQTDGNTMTYEQKAALLETIKNSYSLFDTKNEAHQSVLADRNKFAPFLHHAATTTTQKQMDLWGPRDQAIAQQHPLHTATRSYTTSSSKIDSSFWKLPRLEPTSSSSTTTICPYSNIFRMNFEPFNPLSPGSASIISSTV